MLINKAPKNDARARKPFGLRNDKQIMITPDIV